MFWNQSKIKNISEFKNLDFPIYWAFRGQSQDWIIKESIYRWLDELQLEHYWLNDSQTNFEEFFINQFKEKSKMIDQNSKAETLALMQHYGFPTRLIDFSKSFDVAMYFAVNSCENASKDGVIWGINMAILQEYHYSNGVIKERYPIENEYKSKQFNRNILVPFIQHVDLYTEQQINNLRFQRQKCLFFLTNLPCFHNNMFYSFNLNENNYLQNNISEIDLSYTPLIKFIIPNYLKSDIKDYLNKKGINKEYLFPTENNKMKEICSQIITDFEKQESKS